MYSDALREHYTNPLFAQITLKERGKTLRKGKKCGRKKMRVKEKKGRGQRERGEKGKGEKMKIRKREYGGKSKREKKKAVPWED